jgi:hypothetical protein
MNDTFHAYRINGSMTEEPTFAFTILMDSNFPESQ